MQSCKCLRANNSGQIDWRAVDVPAPGPGHVLVRLKYSGVRERMAGAPCVNDLTSVDNLSNVNSLPGGASVPNETYPLNSWGVGEVIERHRDAKAFEIGDWVFGPMALQPIQTVPVARLHPLDHWKPEFAVFVEAGIAALRCVHRSGMRYGDRVAIVGMGTVGLMAMQYAMLSGAAEITAIEPIAIRRKTALRLGAHHAFSSGEDWAAWSKKQERAIVENPKIALELSGADSGLETARDLAQAGDTLVLGGNGLSDAALAGDQRNRGQERAVEIRLEERPSTRHEENTVIQSMKAKRVIVWPIPFETVSCDTLSNALPSDAALSNPGGILLNQPKTHVKWILDYEL